MASIEEMQEQVQDLILVLGYLSGWDENADRKRGPAPMLTSSRQFDLDSLLALDDDGYLSLSRRQDMFMLTKQGRDRARELIYEWGLQFPADGPGL